MQKTGLVVFAALAVVGGLFVVYSGMDSPSGLAVGTADGEAAALVHDLGSRNRKKRRAAAAALGRTAELSALTALVAASTHEDSAFVDEVQDAIAQIVKRFPKNLGAFDAYDWQVSLRSIVNESDGGDEVAGAVKDGLLEVLLEVDNVQVGASADFDDGVAASAMPARPRVSVDFSGKLVRSDDKHCRLELDLALTDADVVVKRFRKIRASGEAVADTAQECGREAARQALRYLGAE